eukprot:831205-Pleurochrysis_carterae.AAC.2
MEPNRTYQDMVFRQGKVRLFLSQFRRGLYHFNSESDWFWQLLACDGSAVQRVVAVQASLHTWYWLGPWVTAPVVLYSRQVACAKVVLHHGRFRSM